ncbi:MAG: hypothetical protein HY303_21285 [Candidatus Wallbacteria bacterium]|nr:hypothetical protein [Candidatus Wallbacteria bacterium]
MKRTGRATWIVVALVGLAMLIGGASQAWAGKGGTVAAGTTVQPAAAAPLHVPDPKQKETSARDRVLKAIRKWWKDEGAAQTSYPATPDGLDQFCYDKGLDKMKQRAQDAHFPNADLSTVKKAKDFFRDNDITVGTCTAPKDADRADRHFLGAANAALSALTGFDDVVTEALAHQLDGDLTCTQCKAMYGNCAYCYPSPCGVCP